MSLAAWSWIFFGIFFVVIFALSYYGYKKTTSAIAFSTAPRAYSPLIIGIAVTATSASAAALLGNPGLVCAGLAGAVVRDGRLRCHGSGMGVLGANFVAYRQKRKCQVDGRLYGYPIPKPITACGDGISGNIQYLLYCRTIRGLRPGVHRICRQ